MVKKILNRYPALKTAWREVFHRPRWYGDKFHELEQLFQWSEDPWNFERSRYEQERLRVLLDHVKQYPHEKILEVGCAEGIFTAELNKIAKEVVAIDVSPTALARAKRRCPEVTFLLTNLQEFTWDSQFDIVICAETLYYIKDVAAAIQKLTSLGKYCLVSYGQSKTKRLDPYISRVPLLEYEKFEKSYWLWKRAMNIAVWENNHQ